MILSAPRSVSGHVLEPLPVSCTAPVPTTGMGSRSPRSKASVNGARCTLAFRDECHDEKGEGTTIKGFQRFRKPAMPAIPPTVPKFPEDKTQTPVGITRDEPHSYSDTHDTYYRLAYIAAMLRAKTCSPWYEIAPAPGKTLKADEYDLLPQYQDEIERLKLAKASFQEQAKQLKEAYADYALKMIEFRANQRNWEVELLEAVHKSNLSTLHDKSTMAKIRAWAKQENRKDDDGEYETFFYGEPAKLDNLPIYPGQWNRSRGAPLPLWIPQRLQDLNTSIEKVDTLIASLSKPQTRQTVKVNTKGKKRVFSYMEVKRHTI